ncbi:MAG: hypothetical protein VW268_09320 [Rhodospirillaceae bacterium]
MADDPDTDQPDIDHLARQYLDLWQEHLKTMAADPKVAETMSQVTQMMTGQTAAFAALAQQSLGQAAPFAPPPFIQTMWPGQMTPAPSTDGAPNDTADTRPGTQTAGPAHGGADVDMAELTRRLDGIERRLTALEAGTGKPGERSGKCAGKNKA